MRMGGGGERANAVKSKTNKNMKEKKIKNLHHFRFLK